MCGEQHVDGFLAQGINGSSPRVRGTGYRAGSPTRNGRFIPACAGNSHAINLNRAARSVHPRVCGEQCCLLVCYPARRGSSPRVRGTDTLRWENGASGRFIPACAGNSRASSTTAPHSSVHPRVCGEQPARSNIVATLPGSSPRVRGTAILQHRLQAQMRFIPACAGNSWCWCRCWWQVPVHPRVCGEQATPRGFSHVRNGSSPRVRGTDDYACEFYGRQRFIPACAGNSFIVRCAHTSGSVHPRVCGEQKRDRH